METADYTRNSETGRFHLTTATDCRCGKGHPMLADLRRIIILFYVSQSGFQRVENSQSAD